MVFRKVPYLDLSFSIYAYVLCFFPEKKLVLQVMQMVTLSIQLRKRETVINTIETQSQDLFNWFSDNIGKANSGKSHLLMSETETTHANVSQKEILLDINLDRELKFEDHVKTLYSCLNCAMRGFKTEEKYYESLC